MNEESNSLVTFAMHHMFKDTILVHPLPEEEIKKIAKECSQGKWYNATPENIDSNPPAKMLLAMALDKNQFLPNDLEILISQGCGQIFPSCKFILRSDFIKISKLYNKAIEVFN